MGHSWVSNILAGINTAKQTLAVAVLGIVMLVVVNRTRAAEPAAAPLDVDSAVTLCREYFASEDEGQRAMLTKWLARYDGDIDPVIRKLSTRNYSAVKTGYHAELKFKSAQKRDKYPRDLLYFVVPKNYDEKRPTGLIVFLHGGGFYTSRDAPMDTLRIDSEMPDEDESGKMLAATGMITVGPSAPGKHESSYRWCLRASEEYLVDVIDDCKSRFNIDPDRVFLLGHSMGGFGAFHHGQRQPDRFAAIIVSSGAWDCGYWPVIRGTPLFMIAGVNDALKGHRWHYTDVEYSRKSHKIFEREGLDHKYVEHKGLHSFAENRDSIAEYFAATKDLRRDPYFPHVCLATPQGFTWNYLNRVQHNRWLTLDETKDGDLKVDELVSRGNTFDDWRLEHRRSTRNGAAVEAINRGNNRINVTTTNVTKFTVWLHPKMVDVSKPVTISVDDKQRFTSTLKLSLATALESYERRRDWGMIYPMKVVIELGD